MPREELLDFSVVSRADGRTRNGDQEEDRKTADGEEDRELPDELLKSQDPPSLEDLESNTLN